ncbi:acetyltransferase [Polaribacter reichenbachii]|uniref:Acetyltransferase n=1 Tax=Polaribacter reichenbachii TaxID=996801 RepID=A0A1B8TWJ7_9FLAO|nr:acyltransferase [Polaribacter reichenbachii]APZ45112.1 acetyltransferase [Polaribacter reichenbachii]AUC18974.1 acetyltransferase [Polaribacter reichenbachii]OBY63869.1 acetyltransferase [Polaribacter reichenbachii]
MGLKEKIKSNERIKKLVHWSILIPKQTRPRLWIKWFVNPFYHKKGKGAIVRPRTRMDVVPWNKFEMGEDSTIEDFSAINNGVGSVIIGDRTKIGLSNTIIGPVRIGNDIRLAQNITLSGLNHNYEDVNLPIHVQGVSTSPIVIEDDSWLGANVVVVAGVTIGKHSIIAAGSIVTKNIPPYSVAVGNPARVLKQYNHQTKVWEKVK